MAKDTSTAVLETARNRAAEVQARLGRRRAEAGAPVRKSFVLASERKSFDLTSEPYEELPPMARLLRETRRGGALRVKLYLSVLWRAARAPFDVEGVPARSWAELLGLEDPGGNGERRIRQAIRDLVDHRLLEQRHVGGAPSILRPLMESGTGKPYLPPAEAQHQLRSRPRDERRRHDYFKLPSSLWTFGHLAQLEGPGLAMLLILKAKQRPNQASVLIDRGTADAEFGLSERTRGKGLEELRQLGLLTTAVASVDDRGDGLGFTRRRNVHTLDLVGIEFKSLLDLLNGTQGG